MRSAKAPLFGVSFLAIAILAGGACAHRTVHEEVADRAPASDLEGVISQSIRRSEPVSNTGVAVAVIQDGEVSLLKGYGFRVREKKLPVTQDTVFVLGSFSKAFTALGLVMESERGHIKLASPVRGYLRDFKLKNPTASSQANAIDLLAHRLGLPRHDSLWYLSGFDRYELVNRMRHLDGSSESGSGFRQKWQYNNLGYVAAGTLLERVSGSRWEDYIEDRILRPLGMTESTTSLRDVRGGDVALGYDKSARLPYKDVTNIAGAAGLNGSVRDLVKWAQFHLRHGALENGSRLVSEAGWRSLIDVHSQIAPNRWYGLGWIVEDFQGKHALRHVGSMDGFQSVISLVPERNFAIIVLTNQNSGPLAYQVVSDVYRNLYAGVPSGIAANAKDDGSDRDPAPAAVAEWPVPRGFEGKYANDAYGTMEIVANGSGRGQLRYFQHLWPIRAHFGGKPYVTIDFGGRTEDFDLVFDRKGFSIRFEKEVAPYFFSR